VDQAITLSFIQVNACYQNEPVNLNGVFSTTTRTKLQPDGTYSVKESVSVAATGTGTISGADYTLSDTTLAHIDGIGSLPFNNDLNRVTKMIGNGVPDMYLHWKFRLTLNADGTITHAVQYVTTTCNP